MVGAKWNRSVMSCWALEDSLTATPRGRSVARRWARPVREGHRAALVRDGDGEGGASPVGQPGRVSMGVSGSLACRSGLVGLGHCPRSRQARFARPARSR